MNTTAEIATLAHGYTMGHIEGLVRACVEEYRSSASDHDEAYAQAWSAVIARLYEEGGEMQCSCSYPPHRAPSHRQLWYEAWSVLTAPVEVDDVYLRHGFTMADVDKLSRKAAYQARSRSLDFDERREYAWLALVELIYETDEDEPIAWHTALNHASDAVDSESRRVLGSRGIRAGEIGVDEHDHRPRFLQFWLPVTAPLSDFTERVVELQALPQVLAKLSDLEYEAIVTLAAYGSQKGAAEALGITTGAFGMRLWQARAKAWRHWYEHETPPPKTRQGPETCRYGHSKVLYAFNHTNGSVGCRKCARRRAVMSYARNRDNHLKLDLDPIDGDYDDYGDDLDDLQDAAPSG